MNLYNLPPMMDQAQCRIKRPLRQSLLRKQHYKNHLKSIFYNYYLTYLLDYNLNLFLETPTQTNSDLFYNLLTDTIHRAACVTIGHHNQNRDHKTPNILENPPLSTIYKSVNAELHKKTKFSEDYNPPSQDQIQQHFYELWAKKSNTRLPIIPHDQQINSPFTTTNVKKFSQNYPINRTSGMDQLPALVFRVLMDGPLLVLVSKFLSACYLYNILPFQMRVFKTILIPKNNRNSNPELNELRPIGISNFMRLIYESIIKNELTTYIPIHPSQTGFQRKRSTNCNLQWVQETQDPETKTLLLDLEKAYDCVDIAVLIRTLLLNHDIPLHYISIISQLFNTTYTKIYFNDRCTRYIKRTRGLAQGSVLAPLLFNAYINPLAQALNNIPGLDFPIGASLFADDVCVRTKKNEIIYRSWNCIIDWCDQYFISPSTTKTVTINYTGQPLQYRQQRIPNKNVSRYLGLSIGPLGLKFFQYATAMIEQANRSLMQIKDKFNHIIPHKKLLIFKTYIRSKIEYALVLSNHYMTLSERFIIINKYQALLKNSCLWITNTLIFPQRLQHNLRFLRLCLGLESYYDRINGLEAAVGLSPPLWIPSPYEHPIHRSLRNSPTLHQYNHYCEIIQQQQRPSPLKTWYKTKWIASQQETIPGLEELQRSYPSGSLEILRLETNEAIQEALNIAFPTR